MKRTQLYLEGNVWKHLHILARQSNSSVSELVRQAVREKYFDKGVNRKEAMLAVVGLWKRRTDVSATETYVRRLREDDRLKRISR